jgi:hypothetical protein
MSAPLKALYARLEMHYFREYDALHARMADAKWHRHDFLNGSFKLLPTGMYVSRSYNDIGEAQASIERAVLPLAPSYDEETLIIEAASVSSFNLKRTIAGFRTELLKALRSATPPAPRATSNIAKTLEPRESVHEALVRALAGTPKR